MTEPPLVAPLGFAPQVKVINWPLGDLAGVAEITAVLGMSRQGVSNLLARPGSAFPAPLVRLRCGPLMSRTLALRWQDEHR